jgi:hypothetical protein
MIRNPDHGDRCVLGGSVGGMTGGLAIAVLMIAHAAINGLNVWPALKAAALPLFGTRVFEPGFDLLPVVIGVSNHFAISMVWGVVFAVLAYGLSRVATLAAALAWGLVVWFGMYFVVLPVSGWGDVARAAPVNVALFQHLLFGLAMGLGFLPFQRTHIVREAATT